jgi:hypothetical protein
VGASCRILPCGPLFGDPMMFAEMCTGITDQSSSQELKYSNVILTAYEQQIGFELCWELHVLIFDPNSLF